MRVNRADASIKPLQTRTSLLKVMLLGSALLMGYSDLITTNEILHLGLGELNPFMRLAQEWLGEWWFIPKLGLTCVVAWLLWRDKNVRHVAVVMAFVAMPVFNNLIILATN